MSAGEKTIEEKQTILFESMQRLRQDFELHSWIFYNVECSIL